MFYSFYRPELDIDPIQDQNLDTDLVLDQHLDQHLDPDQDLDPYKAALDLGQYPDQDQAQALDQDLDIGSAVFRIRFIDHSQTKI